MGGTFDFYDKVGQGIGGLFVECDVTFLSNLIFSTFGLRIANMALFRTKLASRLKVIG